MRFSTKDIVNTEPELWDVESPPSQGKKGFYICISGNTGAGKSTLIRNVVEKAKMLGVNILGISERTLHHPYLRCMFSNPKNYAYPVQLNFMLHRHLVLLRQMELGRPIFMERSHLDDQLFLREHAEQENISKEQVNAYHILATQLHQKVPAPDLFILMNPTPELSIERVGIAEQRGDRPKEFPSEDEKCKWIYRWHSLYCKFHQEIPEMLDNKTRLLTLDANEPLENRIDSVIKVLMEMGLLQKAENSLVEY